MLSVFVVLPASPNYVCHVMLVTSPSTTPHPVWLWSTWSSVIDVSVQEQVVFGFVAIATRRPLVLRDRVERMSKLSARDNVVVCQTRKLPDRVIHFQS